MSSWGKEPTAWCTVTNQAEAEEKIPKMLAQRARLHCVRIEPMLGPIDIRAVLTDGHTLGRGLYSKVTDSGIDFVICAGGVFPMHPDWVRSLRDQCADAGVAFWLEGWGEWMPLPRKKKDIAALPSRIANAPRHVFDEATPQEQIMAQVEPWMGHRQLDGREHNGLPT